MGAACLYIHCTEASGEVSQSLFLKKIPRSFLELSGNFPDASVQYMYKQYI